MRRTNQFLCFLYCCGESLNYSYVRNFLLIDLERCACLMNTSGYFSIVPALQQTRTVNLSFLFFSFGKICFAIVSSVSVLPPKLHSSEVNIFFRKTLTILNSTLCFWVLLFSLLTSPALLWKQKCFDLHLQLNFERQTLKNYNLWTFLFDLCL